MIILFRNWTFSTLRNDASFTCQSGRPGMADLRNSSLASSPKFRRTSSAAFHSSSSTKSALYRGGAAYICVTGTHTCWWTWGRFYIWITYSPLTPDFTIHWMSMREYHRWRLKTCKQCDFKNMNQCRLVYNFSTQILISQKSFLSSRGWHLFIFYFFILFSSSPCIFKKKCNNVHINAFCNNMYVFN